MLNVKNIIKENVVFIHRSSILQGLREIKQGSFLAATKQLYGHFFPSVCLFVCLSVCLWHLFH